VCVCVFVCACLCVCVSVGVVKKAIKSWFSAIFERGLSRMRWEAASGYASLRCRIDESVGVTQLFHIYHRCVCV